MRKEGFKAFCDEVRCAAHSDGIWRWSDYWTGMSAKQRVVMAGILDHHPDVMKIERDGQKVYQLPTGREWTA